MSAAAGVSGANPGELPQVLAFYLPQFHHVPENDAWHGTGFTEWTVVAQSRPLFPGHYQPHLPSELGFYDLRVPETREAQARLAQAHGIDGFVYYHYWFHGQRMLERPFQEVLRSGRPDFPFALCWANESWFRRWQGLVDELVVEQAYSEEDDLAHVRYLIEAFKDRRYIQVRGRPLLCAYRPQLIPEPKRFVELLREECGRAGVAEPWLVGFETGLAGPPGDVGFDATAEFVPHGIPELLARQDNPPGCDPTNALYDYAAVATAYGDRPSVPWTRYPCVATGWDNTPRRRNGEALILTGATPERYGAWLESAMRRQAKENPGDGVVFVNAWNEWAEGAHLEPDVRWGRAYLEKTRDVLEGLGRVPACVPTPDLDAPDPVPVEDLYAELYDRFVELQTSSSGYVAWADRRLKTWQEYYQKRLDEAEEEKRRLAGWAARLEGQLAFERERLSEALRFLNEPATGAGRE